MKKKRLIPLILALCLALPACTPAGGNTDSTDSTASEKEETQVTTEKNTATTETESLSETLTVTETETEPVETEEDTTPLLEGPYASSIEYAERLRGEVNASYNQNRSIVTLSNGKATLLYPLNGSLDGSALTTPGGKSYLDSLPEIFITNTEGSVFYATNSGLSERMNIYRLGSYYYEVHMLDGGVAGERVSEKELSLRSFRQGNNISDVVATNESLTFTVKDSYDPYINGTGISFDADQYNAIELTLTCTVSSSMQIYLAAGPNSGVTGSQMVSIKVEPDGQPHTYLIPFTTVSDYYGKVRTLRFDIGEAGEEITITNLKAVELSSDAPAVRLDHTYHLYSDKINDVTRFVAEKQVTNLRSVGSITKIAAETVEKLVIKDKNGTHSSLDGVDFASAEYVAFDIKNVGIYGHILLPSETSGRLTVTLENGNYVIKQELTLADGTVLNAGSEIKTGHRIYTDLRHEFDAFLVTAEIERNPLSEVSVTASADGSRYAGYDVFRGAYRFNINGHGFQTAYDNPYRRFIVDAMFKGADVDYPIYVFSNTSAGNLESGALLSADDQMLPIALEVCKNFQGENEEPFYDKGDPAYGEIIFPMVIKAKETTEFSIVNLYQNWGNYPLKQISSIQFIAPYYHLSVGSTETNCIAPYYVYGKDYWTLPDFRAMSAPLWSGQPQHASIGRLYFLKYTDAEGKFYGSESIDNIIDSYGPTYSDIDMNYLSDDGKIEAYYRHLEFPQWDENRTYYTIELNIKDTISIKDFKNDFSFFSFDGRSIYFKKLGYLNEQNECVVVDANSSGNAKFIKLGDKCPYISYFDGNENMKPTDYVNFGLVIKDADIVIGGKKYEGGFIFRDVKKGDLNQMSLSLDLGEVTLQAGDRITINMVLLPWGEPSSDNDQSVRTVREDSCLKPYSVEVAVGTEIEDAYLPRIIADKETAEFTLSGGASYSVVRIYGFKDYSGIKVEEKIDGKWVEYILNSKDCSYDGYTVYYEGDGTFSYAFVADMDEGTRTFRVTAK